MKTRSITLIKRLSQLVTNVINLANQWPKNCVMPYENVFKIQAQQINMVEDDNDGDSDYNDPIRIIKATIATIDLDKQMLMKMSEHKEDNWYADCGANKHVMGNSSLFHDIVKTHSSSSVISTSGHTHGVEGKCHAKLRFNGLMKKIIDVF
jgi:hypothetical protein